MLFEALEPRLLLAAGWDIVLIDTALPQWDVLAASAVEADKVIPYDSAAESPADVLSRVAEVARANNTNVNSLSTISHGVPGRFALGNEWVSAQNLEATSLAWTQLSEVLADDADLYIFGCSVADGSGGGQGLLDSLALLTGADVFASDDVTGTGGDWVLEAASAGAGEIQGDLPHPLDEDVLVAYRWDLSFTDVTTAAGLNGISNTYGVAWGDFNGDGYPDVFISGSDTLRSNNGDGTFSSGGSPDGDGRGAHWADYDNDGDLDLVATLGLYLSRNDGGSFTLQDNAAIGLTPINNLGDVAWLDYNHDGCLDLWAPNGSSPYAYLFRSDGDGTFTGVEGDTIGLAADTNGESTIVADYDGDGWTDILYRAGSVYLWHNNGDGTFTDVTAAAGVSLSSGSGGYSGTAFGDYDNDGDLDLYGGQDGANKLYRNNNGTFTDVTATAGVAGSSATTKGVAWGDYDDDGDLDLYVAQENGANHLFENKTDGTFTDVAAVLGLDDASASYGVVWTDYDIDGDLDLFVGNNSGVSKLFRNNLNDTDYLKVRVMGFGAGASPVDGTGSRVGLYDAAGTTLLAVREIVGAEGMGSHSTRIQHIGLADAWGGGTGTYTVKVVYTSGVVVTTSGVVPTSTSTTVGSTVLSQTLDVAEGSLLLVGDHGSGQESNAFGTGGAAVTDAELFAFSLSPVGTGPHDVTQLVFDLSGITGMVSGDLTGAEILVDADGNGTIDAGETVAVGGAGVVSIIGATGTITFSSSFTILADTDYIVRADVASLAGGDGLTLELDATDVTATTDVSGAATSASHWQMLVNTRSIGTEAGTLYATGTASVSAGGMTVTFGGGASLPANVGAGDRITLNPGPGQEVLYILSRDDATQVTVQGTAAGTHTDVAFTIERAFNTIGTWESARDGDLLGEQRREIGMCYNDGVFDEFVTIDGSTTDADYYMWLTVAWGQRHDGVAGGGTVLHPTGAGHAVRVLDDYTRVEWLEITDWSTDTTGSYDAINLQADNTLVQYVLIHDDGHGSQTNSDANGITVELNNLTATVRGSILYNIARSGISIHNVSGCTLYVENCTVLACTQADSLSSGYGCVGRYGGSGTIHVKNTIAMNTEMSGNDFFGGTWGDCSNNMSSDGTAPGTSSIPSASAVDQFVSIGFGSEDFHLLSDADAVDAGTDLSGSVDNDIDGFARPIGSGWDMGADEYNGAPTVSDDTFSIPENAPNGTVVGTVSASDPDPGDTLTYSITAGNEDGAFAIDSATGEITVADNTQLDYVVIPLYSLTVQVEDTGGATDTAVITVNVTEPNIDPTAVDDSYDVDVDTLFASWWNTLWTRRRMLTFDNSSQTENLTEFPVLVTLDATRIDYSQTQDAGQDLRFVDADGTVLSHEIELWDEGGTSYVWVRVPQVDGGSDTDTLWMYYGNAGAPDGQDPASVWSADYAGVWHLHEDASGTGTEDVYQDSTAYGNHGDDYVSATGQGGQVGGGQEFDGSDDYIDVGSPASLQLTGEFSVFAWVKFDSLASDQHIVGYLRYHPTYDENLFGYSLWFHAGDNKLYAYTRADDYDRMYSPDNVINDNEWHLVGMTWKLNDDDMTKLYVDGVEVPTTLYGSVNDRDPSYGSGASLDIGRAAGTEDQYVAGLIDEVRISSTARSADWIAADHLSTTDGLITYADEDVVGQPGVLSNDTDPNGDPLTAMLVGGPSHAEAFTLYDDGSFVYTPASGYTGPDSFTYKANDGTTDSNTATVTLNVGNVAPVVNDQGFGVDENSADGTSVGTVIANDPDPGDTLTYSILAGNDAGVFAIDSATGEITVADGSQLDYEVGPTSYSLTVEVEDTGGLTDTATVTIDVNDLNESPVINDQSVPNLDENSANGTSVGTVVASDPDAGDSLTYTITAGNVSGAFAIDPNTGEITVNNAAALDFEATPTFSLTVEAHDAGGLTDTAAVTINLNDLNEAPALGDQSFTVQENSPDGTLVGTLAASDPDADDTVTYTITSGNDAGVFAIDASTGQISVADGTQLDFESGPASYSLTVEVEDIGGLTDTATIVIGLAGLNEAPTIDDQDLMINDASPTATVVATDLDVGDVLTHAIIAGNVGGTLAMDGASGQIRVANADMLLGLPVAVFNLTVEVRDSGGLTDSAAVTLTVVNADAPPDETGAPSTGDDGDEEPDDDGAGEEPGQGEDGSGDPDMGEGDDADSTEPPADVYGGGTPSGGPGAPEDAPPAAQEPPPPALPGEQEPEDPPAPANDDTPTEDVDAPDGQAQPQSEPRTQHVSAAQPRPDQTNAVTPPVGMLPGTTYDVLLKSPVWRDLDKTARELNDQMDRENRSREVTVGVAAGLTVAISAVYLAWLLRGGWLVASALTSMRLWRWADPLPLLEYWEKKEHERRQAVLNRETDSSSTEENLTRWMS